ncbi:MAG: ferric reductase-like transmembrane domain-containing protein [Alphaproteobacteria bacterium]
MIDKQTHHRIRFDPGWKIRHLGVIGVATLIAYGFLLSRPEWAEMHRWNRALGDASFVLVALAMAIGPLSRLLPSFRMAIPWRREFGVHGVLLGMAHVVVILFGWVELDLVRLFGYEVHPATERYVMVQHGFGLANTIGIVAAVYGTMLAAISNTWSQRRLGGPVWKFFQQSSYVLWMLIVLHTGYFLFLHFQDFHRRVPEPNWAQWPFAVVVLAILSLQIAASIQTWRPRLHRRGRMTGLTDSRS